MGSSVFSPAGASLVVRCGNCPSFGSRYGIYADILASGSVTEVVALKGRATSSSTEDENIGVWGWAGNADDFNAGIKGTVQGSSGSRWGGYFNGNVHTTGNYSSSDERLKKNIRTVNSSEMLAGIMELEPRRFEYLSPDELQQQRFPRFAASEGDQLGLIAQNLETVFPELVMDVLGPLDYEDNGGERFSMYKAVNYSGLIPVLIAGMQAQQEQIDELVARIELLENMMMD